MSKFNIRSAMPDQAAELSVLAQRSKAHWGYSAEFMQAVVAELTYTPEQVTARPTFVATTNDQLAGFYQLTVIDTEQIELEALFVEPDWIGRGVGQALFRHAVTTAQQHHQQMIIQSDPAAAGFYQRMGCRIIGHKVSLSVAGRPLPLLSYDLLD